MRRARSSQATPWRGGALGAVVAVVLAILVKLFELAIKLLVICVQIALAGGAIYLLARWLEH